MTPSHPYRPSEEHDLLRDTARSRPEAISALGKTARVRAAGRLLGGRDLARDRRVERTTRTPAITRIHAGTDQVRRIVMPRNPLSHTGVAR
ncbi:hypothetical protein ACFQ9U_00705 [Streptomyces sp. NPDC056568]|uniref:hypothetical protein n=1 Tax=Streptomyces sp. NPDC056568 TaxID=3345866 RepID=UPI0036A703CF